MLPFRAQPPTMLQRVGVASALLLAACVRPSCSVSISVEEDVSPDVLGSSSNDEELNELLGGVLATAGGGRPKVHRVEEYEEEGSGKASGKGKGGRDKKGKSKAKSRSTKAGLQFPVGRIHRYLKGSSFACCMRV